MITSCTNSSAVTWDSATVNGSTEKGVDTELRDQFAHRRRVVNSAGWLPGRAASAGCE